jgi:hypothetical protein
MITARQRDLSDSGGCKVLYEVRRTEIVRLTRRVLLKKYTLAHTELN